MIRQHARVGTRHAPRPPEQISGVGISGLASGHHRCRYEGAASGRLHPEGKRTGFCCLGLLRSAPLINLPFPSCFCLCCAVALLQLSGLPPPGRETIPSGVDDSRQSVCASEWSVVSGHWSHPAGESLQGLWDSPGSASPRIFRRMETSEPSGCATLAAEDGYPLQPQDSFEICFASPGFFSGGFRETSSKPDKY